VQFRTRAGALVTTSPEQFDVFDLRFDFGEVTH